MMENDENYDHSVWISNVDEMYEAPDVSQKQMIRRKSVNSRVYKHEYNDDDIDGSSNISASEDSEDGKFCARNRRIEDIEIKQIKKKMSPKKSFSIRCPTKWSPKIESVCHVPHTTFEPVKKYENENLVLVKEDVIKQELELFNENDDDPLHPNDFQKSILAEYPNLKIKDEFEFKACCIKLEKMDFSHVENTNTTISPIKVNPIRNSPKSTRSSCDKSRPRKKKKGRRLMAGKTRRGGKSRNTTVKSAKARVSKAGRVKSREYNENRRSSRLLQKSCEGTEETEQIQNQSALDGKMKKSVISRENEDIDNERIIPKKRKNSNEKRARKKTYDEALNSCPTSVVSSNNSDIKSSKLTRSQKTLFMEANGLTDSSRKSSLKSKTDNSLKSKVKRVSFAKLNGLSPDRKQTFQEQPEENEKLIPRKELEKENDPAEEYRLAIEKYSNEAENYKVELDTWYECLCCDRKYHLIEQCKEHVRSHFSGMLTN